jgi:hypothetical protein
MLLAATTRPAMPRNACIKDFAWAPDLSIRSMTTSAFGRIAVKPRCPAEDRLGRQIRWRGATLENRH